MIGEIGLGNQFLGLCRYAIDEAKDAKVLAAHGVRWWSAEEMAADFELQRASLRPSLNQAVLHVALAWHPTETELLTDRLMVRLAEEYLDGMGINPEKTQWALIRHFDQNHPHGHLIVNRVTHEGEAIDCGKNYQKSHDICRDLEQKYGLVDASEIGEARHRKLVERRALGEQTALELKVCDALDQHVPHQTSPRGLIEALVTAKITMLPEYDEQGKMKSVTFAHEDHPGLRVKGSALRPEYGGRELDETLARHAEYQLDPPIIEKEASWLALDGRPVASSFWLGHVETDYTASRTTTTSKEAPITSEAAAWVSTLAQAVDQLEQHLVGASVEPVITFRQPARSLEPNNAPETEQLPPQWEHEM